MAALKWSNIDFQWKKLTLADKVGETRVIPLTPYLASLLAALSRAKLRDGVPNPFVFASTGKTGRIAEPRAPHPGVLADAGIPHVSIHGLRRTRSMPSPKCTRPGSGWATH